MDCHPRCSCAPQMRTQEEGGWRLLVSCSRAARTKGRSNGNTAGSAHCMRAVGDQSASTPGGVDEQAWRDHLYIYKWSARRAQWEQHGCHSKGRNTSELGGIIYISVAPPVMFRGRAFGEQEDDQAARAYSSISLTDRVWPFSVILASIRSPGFARVGTFVSRVSFNSMCWPVAVVTV